MANLLDNNNYETRDNKNCLKMKFLPLDILVRSRKV